MPVRFLRMIANDFVDDGRHQTRDETIVTQTPQSLRIAVEQRLLKIVDFRAERREFLSDHRKLKRRNERIRFSSDRTDSERKNRSFSERIEVEKSQIELRNGLDEFGEFFDDRRS